MIPRLLTNQKKSEVIFKIWQNYFCIMSAVSSYCEFSPHEFSPVCYKHQKFSQTFQLMKFSRLCLVAKQIQKEMNYRNE